MKVELITEGKQIRLVIPKENETKRGSYCVALDSNEVRELYDKLSGLTDKTIKHDDRPYYDEISTYVNEVERTLDISGNKGALKLDLICYTDKEDDNWIGLSPKRIAKLAGVIYQYI